MSDVTQSSPAPEESKGLPRAQIFCTLQKLSQAVGHSILSFLQSIGALAAFIAKAAAHSLTPPFYPRLILKQFIDIGYYSLPVVGMTALFTGMVLALQSYTGFTRFNAESAIAGVVA